MRIIAGRFKGKILVSPQGMIARPTTDRAKEGIFSSIQNRVNNSSFLDLFAGSGSMGIEAISRGASDVTFVEKNKDNLNVIRKNIKELKIIDDINIMFKHEDVLTFLEKNNKKYDIIFLDPPYNYKNKEKILKYIIKNELLSEDGIIIFEMENKETLKLQSEIEVIKEKKYSISKFVFITKKGQQSDV